MREIYFRYRFKHESTIVQFSLEIREIEQGLLQETLKIIDEDLSKFELLTRDESIGRQDFEGKEIFENDIYKGPWGVKKYISHVKFERLENAGQGAMDYVFSSGFYIDGYDKDDLHIFGNRHDNPELLKKTLKRR